MKTKERKKYKSEKGAIAALVIVTILMFIMILMGTYMAIVNLKKSQLESDIRIQQLYGGDVENIEQIYAEIIAKRETPISELKVGDYIKYDSGTNGEIVCRVLYPTSSEYGLQIISDKSVKTVRLGTDDADWNKGKTVYNNAIETLNNEAEAYINPEYAIDARCVGSIPTVGTTGNFIQKDKGTETTLILPPSTWESYIKPSDWLDDDTGCFDTDENYITDEIQMKSINIYDIDEEYWLASRSVHANDTSCHFYIRFVDMDGGSNSFSVCGISNDGFLNAYLGEKSLRPCISLRTDIKIIGGNGSKESPYIIG